MRDSEGRMVMSKCVGKPIERKAVAASKVVGYGGRRRIMSMSNMRNRVDRERQQQSRESYSQPLRRSSGQMHQAHERQRMTIGRRHRLRRSIATVKHVRCYWPPLPWCKSGQLFNSIVT